MYVYGYYCFSGTFTFSQSPSEQLLLLLTVSAKLIAESVFAIIFSGDSLFLVCCFFCLVSFSYCSKRRICSSSVNSISRAKSSKITTLKKLCLRLFFLLPWSHLTLSSSTSFSFCFRRSKASCLANSSSKRAFLKRYLKLFLLCKILLINNFKQFCTFSRKRYGALVVALIGCIDC